MPYQVENVHPELQDVFRQLKAHYDALASFAGDSAGLRHLQGMVNKIDSSRVRGSFLVKDEAVPLYGQGELHSLMYGCYTLLRSKETLMADADVAVDSSLEPIRADLEGLLNALEKCRTGDKTNLPKYQGILDSIDLRRINGVFVPPGETELVGEPKRGQGVLIDLLNDAYGKVYSILESMEPPKDRPVAKELEHVYKSLMALDADIDHYHGDLAGLRRIQGRVNTIDNLKVDGIFGAVQGQAPPHGQGTLCDLLENCHQKVQSKLELMECVDEAVHPSLKPIQKELNAVIRDLKLFGRPDDIATLRRLQGRLDKIDSKRIQGVFIPDGTDVPKDGSVPQALPGQGALHDAIAEAYSIMEDINSKVA